jgi:hypothetical protein
MAFFIANKIRIDYLFTAKYLLLSIDLQIRRPSAQVDIFSIRIYFDANHKLDAALAFHNIIARSFTQNSAPLAM